LLEKDYSQQQELDRAAHQAAVEGRVQAAKEAHEANLVKKARLARLIPDYRKFRQDLAGKRGEEYARKKEEAAMKIEEEKAQRRKQVARAKEEQRKKWEEEERKRQEILAEEARERAGNYSIIRCLESVTDCRLQNWRQRSVDRGRRRLQRGKPSWQRNGSERKRWLPRRRDERQNDGRRRKQPSDSGSERKRQNVERQNVEQKQKPHHRLWQFAQAHSEERSRESPVGDAEVLRLHLHQRLARVRHLPHRTSQARVEEQLSVGVEVGVVDGELARLRGRPVLSPQLLPSPRGRVIRVRERRLPRMTVSRLSGSLKGFGDQRGEGEISAVSSEVSTSLDRVIRNTHTVHLFYCILLPHFRVALTFSMIISFSSTCALRHGACHAPPPFPLPPPFEDK
jgi:hypothetical protein